MKRTALTLAPALASHNLFTYWHSNSELNSLGYYPAMTQVNIKYGVSVEFNSLNKCMPQFLVMHKISPSYEALKEIDDYELVDLPFRWRALIDDNSAIYSFGKAEKSYRYQDTLINRFTVSKEFIMAIRKGYTLHL